MKALPACKEWREFAAARDKYNRTGTDADAVAMTNAWYVWRDSVEQRRGNVLPPVQDIEEMLG